MKITRTTHSKSIIIDLIENSSVALSQSEIQLGINGICDRVTTYRVLERLLVEGKVHKIVNVDGVIKYANCHKCFDKTTHSHNHAHFSCEKCKSVTCLIDVKPVFNLPDQYIVKEINFTLSGLCPQCNY